MATLKELREKQAQLVSEARAEQAKIDANTGEGTAKEIEARFDTIMAEYDRIEEHIKREERLAAAQSRLEEGDDRRPRGEDRAVVPGDDGGEEITHRAAFDAYLRAGMSEMDPEVRAILREHRAQAVGTDSAGGYLAPDEFEARVIESMKAYGPMLDDGVFDVITTGEGRPLELPTEDDTANVGALLAENTQDSEQDIAWGIKTLNAYKYTPKIIRVSEELLQDSVIDVEGRIANAFGTRVGRIVNTHLTTGTGSGQPNGIVTASTAGVTAASNSAITADEIIDLQHSVDPAYRMAPTCRFMFNDTTFKAIRKLKDGQSNYLWQMGDVKTGAPATLLGHSYLINQDMANIGSVAKPLLFGDMAKYAVRRVRGLVLKRLTERYADYHQVGFVGFARFDGELLNTAAVKHLVNAT